MTEQVETRPFPVTSIMRSAGFRKGVEERRAGKPPSFDFFDFGDDDGWSYERGRLWATLAPPSMPLCIGGKINPKAVALFELAYARRLIR